MLSQATANTATVKFFRLVAFFVLVDASDFSNCFIGRKMKLKGGGAETVLHVAEDHPEGEEVNFLFLLPDWLSWWARRSSLRM